MDVRNDSTTGNGSLDECVQLLVTTDGQLQMAGGDTLHLQILGGVTGQLENLKPMTIMVKFRFERLALETHLSSQVLEDGGRVDGGGGADATVGGGAVLQVPVDTTDRELKASTS